MKFYPTLTLLFFIFGCTQKEYIVEDKLHECTVNYYFNHNIDLDAELVEFEKLLLEKKILKSKSGEDYHKLFDDMIAHNFDLVIPQKYDIFFTVDISSFDYNECISEIDASIIKKSKYYQLNVATLDYYTHQHRTKIEDVYQAYQTILSDKDYDHPYYKTKVLLSVLFTSDIEVGIPNKLPTQ